MEADSPQTEAVSFQSEIEGTNLDLNNNRYNKEYFLENDDRKLITGSENITGAGNHVCDLRTASTNDPKCYSDEDTEPVLLSGQGLVGSSELPIGVNEGEKLPLTYKGFSHDIDPDRFIKLERSGKAGVIFSPFRGRD